jgi:hypothetical protein
MFEFTGIASCCPTGLSSYWLMCLHRDSKWHSVTGHLNWHANWHCVNGPYVCVCAIKTSLPSVIPTLQPHKFLRQNLNIAWMPVPIFMKLGTYIMPCEAIILCCYRVSLLCSDCISSHPFVIHSFKSFSPLLSTSYYFLFYWIYLQICTVLLRVLVWPSSVCAQSVTSSFLFQGCGSCLIFLVWAFSAFHLFILASFVFYTGQRMRSVHSLLSYHDLSFSKHYWYAVLVCWAHHSFTGVLLDITFRVPVGPS